jgi:hypothetical protein
MWRSLSNLVRHFQSFGSTPPTPASPPSPSLSDVRAQRLSIDTSLMTHVFVGWLILKSKDYASAAIFLSLRSESSRAQRSSSVISMATTPSITSKDAHLQRYAPLEQVCARARFCQILVVACWPTLANRQALYLLLSATFRIDSTNTIAVLLHANIEFWPLLVACSYCLVIILCFWLRSHRTPA